MATSPSARPRKARKWQGISFRLLLRAEPVLRPSIYALLRVNQVHYSRQRAEMVLLALRFQSFYGRCFTSAAYLAASAGANEKSWDRLLATLRAHGLVSTTRLKRADGRLGVNLIDLRGLWFTLIRRLGRLLFEAQAKIYQCIQSRWSLRWKVRLSTGYTELVIWPLSAPPKTGDR